jgi:hypothetical protein
MAIPSDVLVGGCLPSVFVAIPSWEFKSEAMSNPVRA